MTRIIGLDHGSRRIGVAVGETDTGMAFARTAIHRRSLHADLQAILALAREEAAGLVVVGLPLNMDGSEGPQAVATRAFGSALAAGGVPVAYEDERLTSWAAEQALPGTGTRPRRASGVLDSTAARLILQQYLDAHRRATNHEESE